MFVALALALAFTFALLLVPFGMLYVFERMAGHIVALIDPGPADPVHPVDTERCAAESRLVAALIAGDLDRPGYRERMAELAATTGPVRLPPEPR
jgi:hypothetical protein